MELKQYIASSSIGFVFGIITTVLAEWLKDRRDVKTRKQMYLDSLALAQHEVAFYAEKFDELSEFLGNYIPLAEKIGVPKVSLFDSFISPESLGKIKRELGRVSNNPELMLCLSRCHADICLIEWKMQFVEKINDRDSILTNLSGLKQTTVDTVKQFKLLSALLDQELQNPNTR